MTAVIATAVDVTSLQTTVEVRVFIKCNSIISDRLNLVTSLGTDSVPYQVCFVAVPSLGLELQTGKVENQFVTVGSTSKNTTFIGSIERYFSIKLFIHVSIIAATNQFVENNDFMSEINIDHSLSLDATYISSTIERTNLSGIWNISLTISCGIKHHLWFNTDRHSIHVLIELRLIFDLVRTCKIHLTEVFTTHLSLI